jgi:hypothetical protein
MRKIMNKIMIHLYHPCHKYRLDIWEVDNEEDELIARGQGYASQEELKKLTGMSFEIDETNNFPYETWEWLQNRSEE